MFETLEEAKRLYDYEALRLKRFRIRRPDPVPPMAPRLPADPDMTFGRPTDDGFGNQTLSPLPRADDRRMPAGRAPPCRRPKSTRSAAKG